MSDTTITETIYVVKDRDGNCRYVGRTRLPWVKSIREVTRIFNEHGIQVSHSKVYQIQVQRDDLEAGRPNTRVIRPLPKQAQFHAVGKRGERYL